ncbi:UNKNOWN [Stylonychia lemnae]|uniref:Uncharacterized protein n=1 Tax=Stylonychia lemnae TaxID=5949 RepID=A0A078AJ98_STYLE|nr:UNKNOWN [Stylonychia lemnae]|eukprot:CDW82304.1 UNKNOWN [Stylonychia lemnae]
MRGQDLNSSGNISEEETYKKVPNDQSDVRMDRPQSFRNFSQILKKVTSSQINPNTKSGMISSYIRSSPQSANTANNPNQKGFLHSASVSSLSNIQNFSINPTQVRQSPIKQYSIYNKYLNQQQPIEEINSYRNANNNSQYNVNNHQQMAQKPVQSHVFNNSRNGGADKQDEPDVGTRNSNNLFSKHKKAPSFQQAYQQFAQRLLKESAEGRSNFQTNVLLPSKSIQKFQQVPRTYQNSPSRNTDDIKSNSAYIHERLYKEHQQKKQVKEKIYNPNLKEDQEFSQCTFQPLLSKDSGHNATSYRKPDEFIKDQLKYDVERKERLERKKQEILQKEEEIKRQVEVRLQKSRSPQFRVPLIEQYERQKEFSKQNISQMKSPRDEFRQKHNNSVEYSFKPSINKKSERIIKRSEDWTGAMDHLFKDASNRVQKVTQNQQDKQKKMGGQTKPIEKSNQMMLAAFQKQFNEVCRKVMKGDQSDCLLYEDYLQVLGALGYTFQLKENQKWQLLNLWELLSDNNLKLKHQSLFNALCYINMIQLNVNQAPVESDDIQYLNDIGFEKRNGIFFIDSENKKALTQMFNHFYQLNHNRQAFINLDKREKSLKRTQEVHSSLGSKLFKPALDKKSMSIISNKIGNKSNQEYLKELSLTRQTLKTKVEKMKQDSIDEEVSKCTFKPKINEKISKIFMSKFLLVKGEREYSPQPQFVGYEQLAQPRIRQKDRAIVEIEFEQSKEDCTFAPKLVSKQKMNHQRSVSSLLPNNVPNRKQMNQHQIQPKQVNQQRGGVHQYPRKAVATQELNLMDDSDQEEQKSYILVPLICLDVKIAPEKTEQLLIFEGDDFNLITDKFSQKHGLNQSKKQKLLTIIEKQAQQLIQNRSLQY